MGEIDVLFIVHFFHFLHKEFYSCKVDSNFYPRAYSSVTFVGQGSVDISLFASSEKMDVYMVYFGDVHICSIEVKTKDIWNNPKEPGLEAHCGIFRHFS